MNMKMNINFIIVVCLFVSCFNDLKCYGINTNLNQNDNGVFIINNYHQKVYNTLLMSGLQDNTFISLLETCLPVNKEYFNFNDSSNYNINNLESFSKLVDIIPNVTGSFYYTDNNINDNSKLLSSIYHDVLNNISINSPINPSSFELPELLKYFIYQRSDGSITDSSHIKYYYQYETIYGYTKSKFNLLKSLANCENATQYDINNFNLYGSILSDDMDQLLMEWGAIGDKQQVESKRDQVDMLK